MRVLLQAVSGIIIPNHSRSLFAKAEHNQVSKCNLFHLINSIKRFSSLTIYHQKIFERMLLLETARLYQISNRWSQYRMIDSSMKKCDQAFLLDFQSFIMKIISISIICFVSVLPKFPLGKPSSTKSDVFLHIV